MSEYIDGGAVALALFVIVGGAFLIRAMRAADAVSSAQAELSGIQFRAAQQAIESAGAMPVWPSHADISSQIATIGRRWSEFGLWTTIGQIAEQRASFKALNAGPEQWTALEAQHLTFLRRALARLDGEAGR